MTLPEFKEFPKIARLSREMIVTEKIDGTNAQIYIGEDKTSYAGSAPVPTSASGGVVGFNGVTG